jgi:hypothetical protein
MIFNSLWCITSTKPLKANKRHRSPCSLVLYEVLGNLECENAVPLTLRLEPKGVARPPFCEKILLTLGPATQHALVEDRPARVLKMHSGCSYWASTTETLWGRSAAKDPAHVS